ncbi:LOW QUALITY PROTEIN: cytoplasmic tRNA 2-thiolation protein 2 [Bactrocera neohumeralis]|uniref:LOW QUALITY PROTEIN: cytoplasmic tRNA 2-thiolation protein 2 n=1 Tax=Bactrocera neohumeralis TaxID=98809 RepID=UPI002166A4D4|nr:LOW QUALITY PROTEIN: cytoplasmic tRNA 2-thiolation protein 2 [Bactrocera neohumeralis]
MCSIGDDDVLDDGISSLMTPQEQIVHYLPKGTCYKCGQDGQLYKIHFREAECKNCFLIFVNHKFRATVGSSKALPRNADILLVFDGSAESVVLLDMLQTAQSGSNFKRLHCYLKVLFIDDYEAYKGTCEINDYKLYIQQVKDLLLSYDNIKCYVTNLRSGIHQKPFDIKDMDLYLNREIKKEKVFSNDINNIQTSTSRNEFIKLYRKNLIASMATILSCKYAFIPTISISIATDLLSAIALGQGNNVAYDVAFKDDRLVNGIKIMRPIKDLSETEVLLYIRARNIKWWDRRDHVINASSSIQRITGSFIRNLQKNYSSTVSTIICTGNKITSNNDRYEEFKEKCCLCNSSIVNSETLSAVRYSRYVSERTSSDFDLDTNFKKFLNLTQNQDQKVCHSCQNIGRDSDINLIKHYL